MGPKVGESSGSKTGLSLLPSGYRGQIGGCVGSSEPAGFFGTGNIFVGVGTCVGPLLVVPGKLGKSVLGCTVGTLSNTTGFSNFEDG